MPPRTRSRKRTQKRICCSFETPAPNPKDHATKPREKTSPAKQGSQTKKALCRQQQVRPEGLGQTKRDRQIDEHGCGGGVFRDFSSPQLPPQELLDFPSPPVLQDLSSGELSPKIQEEEESSFNQKYFLELNNALKPLKETVLPKQLVTSHSLTFCRSRMRS